MDTTKSYFLFIFGIMVAMYGYLGYRNYSENLCKIELAKSNRTVEDISKICQ